MRTFLSSESAPWGVLDSWLDQGHTLGIFTVTSDHARSDGWLAEVRGDHRGVWGLAVVDRVVGQPAERLREALDQSKRRQRERRGVSMAPVQARPFPEAPPRRAAVVKDNLKDAPHGAPMDHQGEMRPVLRYGQDRVGQGRWVQLYRFGGLIGTLWTDDAQSLGFIPEPGASVALLVNSIRSDYALGTPTSWVFDDHAGWATRDHRAGPVQRGDLATLGQRLPSTDSPDAR